jgi:hypothetical protein
MTTIGKPTPRFFLGAHQPAWLRDGQAPLFVSDRQLRDRRTFPRAAGPWSLDSGAFSILALGEQFDPPKVYAARARRYRDEIGNLLWIAQQDRMCEPFMLAKTGLSVAEHHRLTVANYAEMCQVATDLDVIPVVQGWTVADYLRCLDLFAAPLSKGGADVDLTTLPLVGLGSVCRRQSTTQAEDIIVALQEAGVTRLHGFGVKILGLRRFGWRLASSDSMAWSYAARRAGSPLSGCAGHINCANCRRYAYSWYVTVAAIANDTTPRPSQLPLFGLSLVEGTAA